MVVRRPDSNAPTATAALHRPTDHRRDSSAGRRQSVPSSPRPGTSLSSWSRSMDGGREEEGDGRRWREPASQPRSGVSASIKRRPQFWTPKPMAGAQPYLLPCRSRSRGLHCLACRPFLPSHFNFFRFFMTREERKKMAGGWRRGRMMMIRMGGGQLAGKGSWRRRSFTPSSTSPAGLPPG